MLGTTRCCFVAALVSLTLGSACVAAEDDDETEFRIVLVNTAPPASVYRVEGFGMRSGEVDPRAIGPGQSSEIDIALPPGARLQIVSMFAESNDCFVAFDPEGFDPWVVPGEPAVGDLTAELSLYDAGTELNGAPGVDLGQAPRQDADNPGRPTKDVITRLSSGPLTPSIDAQGFEYPALASFVNVELEHLGGVEFRVRLHNVSTSETLALVGEGEVEQTTAVTLSPGLAVVQGPGPAVFDVGAPASFALERLAEDGNPVTMLDALGSGPGAPLGPLLWIVHDQPLDAFDFDVGEVASADLQAFVELGAPEPLMTKLRSNPAILDVWLTTKPNGLPPGEHIETSLHARPGATLSVLTPYGVGSDKLLAARSIGLFYAGTPLEGPLEWEFSLYDLGREDDVFPGSDAGPNIEHGAITRIGGEWNGWTYPLANEIVDVWISPLTPPAAAQQ